MTYKVELTYFKRTSGKYYSDGSYISNKEHLIEIWEEVEKMLACKRLPGLINGASEYHVLVNVPEHPHDHPKLILNKFR